jgi:hypothetical protein
MVPDNLTIPALGLLAFLVAFYALLARERKTPYITTFIYPIAAIVTLSILVSSVAPLFQGAFPGVESAMKWTAFVLLGVGLVLVFYNVWRLHNRHVHFRDDHLIKNSRVYRWCYQLKRKFDKAPKYEHNSPVLSKAWPAGAGNDSLIGKTVEALNALPADQIAHSASLAICQRRLAETDELLLAFIREMLSKGWHIQYATCIRHPFELIEKLSRSGILTNPALRIH